MAYYARTKEVKANTALDGISDFNKFNDDVAIELQSLVSVIDVVEDFCWTFSPKRSNFVSTSKVPYIYLVERKQLQNSLLASALYYTTAIGKAGRDLAKSFNTKLDDLLVTGVNFRAETSAFIDKLQPGNSDKALLSDKHKSYTGIYLTQETGFKYALPYYSNNPLTVTNQWSSEASIKSGLQNTVEAGLNIADEIIYNLNAIQPGTFIERPKYYNFGQDDGKEITVTFPLFNTFNRQEDKLAYKQNYELLWILLFQNKPYRTSFARISPPKLYTLVIPGQEFFPYCYVKDIKIEFQGTRRNLSVTSPYEGHGTYETSIPEAYIVSITFKSLLISTGNQMVDKGFVNINAIATQLPSADTAPAPSPAPAPPPTPPPTPPPAPAPRPTPPPATRTPDFRWDIPNFR